MTKWTLPSDPLPVRFAKFNVEKDLPEVIQPLAVGRIIQLSDPKFDPSKIPAETIRGVQIPSKTDISDRSRSDDREAVHTEGAAEAKIAPRPEEGPSRGFAEKSGKYLGFLPVVRAFRDMAKGSGTRVGCIVLGPAFQVLTSGWNGSPRGCKADVDARSIEREDRLAWTCHAESNAIANAARTGTPLEGGVMLVTMFPCMACAKLIVQSGIRKIFTPPPQDSRWSQEHSLASSLFWETNLEVEFY